MNSKEIGRDRCSDVSHECVKDQRECKERINTDKIMGLRNVNLLTYNIVLVVQVKVN